MLNTFKDDLRKKKPNTFTDSNIEDPAIDDQGASAETESVMTDLEKFWTLSGTRKRNIQTNWARIYSRRNSRRYGADSRKCKANYV